MARGKQIRVAIPDRVQMLIDGRLDVRDLDDEEISRMQLRAADGSFRGRPSNYIPRPVVEAMKMEGQRRFQDWVSEAVPEAQRTIMAIMKNSHPVPGDAARLKAAEGILERYAGKVPDKVEMKAEISKWDAIDAEIIVDVEEEDD